MEQRGQMDADSGMVIGKTWAEDRTQESYGEPPQVIF
jgi:hypothetical protein